MSSLADRLDQARQLQGAFGQPATAIEVARPAAVAASTPSPRSRSACTPRSSRPWAPGSTTRTCRRPSSPPRSRSTLQEVIDSEQTPLSHADRTRIAQDVSDDILGHGPLEPYLRDPDITEIMVNGPDDIFIERDGRIFPVDASFGDESHLRRTIDKIVARVGRRVDESSPMVDARLPDGSRVNAVVAPIALDGSLLTIRKFAADPFTDRDLISFGTMNEQVRDFLDACVRGRRNIIISGGTGSGKTTTLNVLSSFLPEDERIITIEDAAELQLHQEHVLRLESRPANIEGRGAIAIRELVRNSLRMRPDRIIVGEVRDGAALDMLQAMNTGHDGSITTVHANTPRDSLSRLETMVLMAGVDLPVRAIREQVSGAIDLIVQQSRLKDGSRRIVADHRGGGHGVGRHHAPGHLPLRLLARVATRTVASVGSSSRPGSARSSPQDLTDLGIDLPLHHFSGSIV